MKFRSVILAFAAILASCASPEPASDVVIIQPQSDKYSPIVRRMTPTMRASAPINLIAQIDSVVDLISMVNSENVTGVYHYRTLKTIQCREVERVTFTVDQKHFVLSNIGQECLPGLSFYIRGAVSKKAGLSDTVKLIVDDGADGRIEMATIIRDQSFTNDSGASRAKGGNMFNSYSSSRLSDYQHEQYWKNEYAEAVETALSVLRPKQKQ